MTQVSRRTSRWVAVGAAAVVVATVGTQAVLAAPEDQVSLTGSNFEIDVDANLRVNGDLPLDWNNVNNISKDDKASGTGDDAFGQGTKEDTAVPTVVSGSIPPNKSDLKKFGVYQEGTSSAGFLNLYWTRVQDPSGTTNMDFEFNQSSTLSSNGVTPVRTQGDLLITYDLTNGGTQALIGRRTWNGSSWGPYTAFDGTVAAGSINSTAIPAGESEVGALSPRTFGEAQIRLSAILPDNGTCTTFGSAYLKSRSSDSFTAAVKDFIAPVGVNITNCGTVNIVKKDDAGNNLGGAEFTLYKNNAPTAAPRGVEDTITTLKCTTSASGTCSITNVPFGDYWAVETVTPAGYETAADQAVTISSATPTVELTFVNPRQRGAIKVTKTFQDKSAEDGSSPHEGVTFEVRQNGVTLDSGVTDAQGVICFDDLLFGSYNIRETVPANFNAAGATTKSVTVDTAATCSSPYGGETVSFVNVPLSKVTVRFDSLVQGVKGPATAATIDCAEGATGLEATTPDETPSAFDDTEEVFTGLEPGTYTCTVVVDP